MKQVLVTGADGFVGKNLISKLNTLKNYNILKFTRKNNYSDLEEFIQKSDFIFHLAGTNRPTNDREFKIDNLDLTQAITSVMKKYKSKSTILFSSSTQANLDNNPYGKSKLDAENLLINFQLDNNSQVIIYRLCGVFGKWSKPNYNSVVATFCHNISRNKEITINDKQKKVVLLYIDDVINSFIQHLNSSTDNELLKPEILDKYEITLEQLSLTIESFKEIRSTQLLPNFSNPFNKKLYSTYLSFLCRDNFSYQVDKKIDERGWLFELIKSKESGQIFVSKTKPGITRGNHYHNTKVEKFCVIQGNAKIYLRDIFEKKTISLEAQGDNIRIIDIPPGYTHSIKNTGDKDLITIFWANEIFKISEPDTYFLEV
jgi:UDP-2-acetamido-2,6-beta-L-arabino-hexul-4-ose reductase